jgi:outer membrane usher protein
MRSAATRPSRNLLKTPQIPIDFRAHAQDSRGTVTALAEHGQGGWTEGAQYNRSVPSDGGIGADLAYLGGASRYQQGDLTWRNRYFQVSGGAYGSGTATGGYTRWGELRGSLVAMDGSVLAANRVNDAFVLVSTQGREGVPVRYENQLIGTTEVGAQVVHDESGQLRSSAGAAIPIWKGCRPTTI